MGIFESIGNLADEGLTGLSELGGPKQQIGGKPVLPTPAREAVHHAGAHTGKKAQEGGEEAEKAVSGALGEVEKFLLKITINTVLLLAGLFLIVYGVMVAVRPRESALSLPSLPSIVPIPV